MTKKGASAASSPSVGLDNGGSSAARFVCSMCAKVYRSGAGLRYHKKKRHRGIVEPTALHRVKCQEPGCTYQMLAISDLRNHLSNHHQKPEYKCTEEKKFTSLADFAEWKASFENLTDSKYVKNCGAKGKSDNQTTEYYYCNRTGPFSQGLRRNKAQGSLRGGIHCTSSMKVEIQNDEHITVQYYPAHYGHSNVTGSDEFHLSDNSMTIGGINGSSSSMISNGHHQQQQQQQQHQQQQQQQQQQDHGQHVLNHYPSNSGDCSSSSSPGSASTSPSGGSNSNSNHPSSTAMISSTDRQSMTNSMKNNDNNNHHYHNNTSNNQNLLQNQMSHCIIISPSFVVEETLPSHSNQHSTPVLVIQQQQQTNQHLSSSTNNITPAANLTAKKDKCVSDIMHETFQILSYWPIDHHQGLMTTENEYQIPHSHVNMDEHLMF
ncbi:hypothetical protein I4U23_007396 [Adineta vaga]|nr:hypothetical protein I4U23_007396 [Adineta vaga]